MLYTTQGPGQQSQTGTHGAWRKNNEKLIFLMAPCRKNRKSEGSSPAIKQACPTMMPVCLILSCSQVPSSHGTLALLETRNGQCPDHACLISGHCPVWPVQCLLETWLHKQTSGLSKGFRIFYSNMI